MISIVRFCKNEIRTCSTEFLVMYRTTVTVFVWPMRCALATAWSSVLGFHWGSTMWTRVAAVSVRLVSC